MANTKIPVELSSTPGIVDNSNATAITITSAENVGIGTSSPVDALHIVSAVSSDYRGNLFLDDSTTGFAAGVGGQITFGAEYRTNGEHTEWAAIQGAKANSIDANYAGTLEFKTRANGGALQAKMILDDSGNVGIGTTSPDAKLHVDGESSSGFAAIFDTSTAYQNFSIFFDASSGNGTTNFSPITYPGSGTANHSFRFRDKVVGAGTTKANVVIDGSLSKGSGSFRIDHPLVSKTDTHHLVHSFVEGPQADNIYRGKVDLVNGSATVNIDNVAGMTEGTFVALNREVQCFTTNESNWDAVKGSVSGNILTIESQNSESTATISWLVIGERKDQHMYDTYWTDDDGKVIVEPLKTNEE